MKKLALTAAAIALACIQTYAQGTVAWSNRNTSLVVYGNHLTNPALVGMGVPQADGVVVELLWSADNTTFTSIDDPTAVGTSATAPGRYNGGNATTGGATAPGSTAFFKLRAWELAFGATFAEASQNIMGGRGAYLGESVSFMAATGGAGSPPSSPVSLSAIVPGFSISAVVPEPSAIALGVLGAGMLLMLVRRK